MIGSKYNYVFCSLFYMLAFIGLCWQIYEISTGYFQFPVVKSISFNLSASNEMKAINMRFLYYEAFDRKRYEKDTGEKIGNHDESFDIFLAVETFSNNVTVDQIMKYTPSVDDLIDSCFLRSTVDCDPKKHISIQKYVSNVFVIYRFIFSNPTGKGYDESTAFYTPRDYGVISHTRIKPEYFKDNFVIGFFLNPANEIPYLENSLAINTDTDYDFETKKQHALSFGLRPHSIIVHKLPAPYNTKCRKKYKLYSCFSECVNKKTVEKLARLASLKYHRYGNRKQMTYFDFKDKNRFKMYSQYVEECRIICPDSECLKEIVITNIEKSALAPLNFYQTLSDNPSFVVHSDPKIHFPDFLTLVLSCFGTWFGLSILSFNPFKWKKFGTHKNGNHTSNTQNDANHSSHIRNSMRNRVSRIADMTDHIKYKMLVRKVERTNQRVQIMMNKMIQHGW